MNKTVAGIRRIKDILMSSQTEMRNGYRLSDNKEMATLVIKWQIICLTLLWKIELASSDTGY